YGRTGALNLAQLGQSLAAGPADRLVVVAFLLLMVGFFVKAAVVPFHFWLADAYALAPIVVGVLFAGVVSELGLYAVARVYWTVFSAPFAGVEGLSGVLLAGGVVLYLVADGLVKGALFISVGIVDHHLHDVDELRLAGKGRHLPWAAAL